ncbi:sn-glycerol-1-phosphate dehydrogenase [Paenibacillaceae bacterium]|nr:sn-glycerol-1-phosphate dehydrogenase [Paenibacillaceae bacterium]
MVKLDDTMKRQLGIDHMFIKAGAVKELPAYLEEKEISRAIMVVDTNTYEAAGKTLEQSLNKNKQQLSITFIQPNPLDDVIADEASIVQLLLDIQQHKPQVVIAVGGGTLHDIVRYAAYTVSLPFLSVPTAPSVDGFNSKGAPIIVRGYKKTIISIGPDAIFADLDILTRAPKAMVAAGFGDIIGKYTSLFDWKFGSLTNDEPYLEQSAMITREALVKCVDQVASIAKRDEEGIATLTSALMESGIAMLILGKSHPASGAEHHLSHFWEMEYISKGRRQLLHGAKVGVACIQIAKLYHKLVEEQFGMQAQARDRVRRNWEHIKNEAKLIPGEAELRELLLQVEGPVDIEQLGVSEDLLSRSLKSAHHIRPERYTLLHAYNES